MQGYGPLSGVRAIELAALGPAPFCGMVLSDLGADVIRVDRPASADHDEERALRDHLVRGRRSVALDLKQPESVDLFLRLVERADVVFEGFRPGVAERLGIGPDVCLARNQRLVYGRMTGYGQDGPLAAAAGHDINYIAVAGALDAIGRPGQRPVPPLNLVADFGGGGMLLAVGVVAALLETQRSGKGQVVDAAMVDGVALLMAMQTSLSAQGLLQGSRGENILDGGAPYYDTYETSDGRYMAVGAIEPQFFSALLTGLGLDAASLPDQDDRDRWPELRDAIAAAFRSEPRAHWEARFAQIDACVSPVLSLSEAVEHDHNRHRRVFVDEGREPEPASAPRFSRTQTRLGGPPPRRPGCDTHEVLAEWLGPARAHPAPVGGHDGCRFEQPGRPSFERGVGVQPSISLCRPSAQVDADAAQEGMSADWWNRP